MTSVSELAATFVARLEDADGRVHRAPDRAAAIAAVRVLVRDAGQAVRGFVSPDAEAAAPGLTAASGLRPLTPDTPTAVLAKAELVVTGAAALIAETGSALLVAGPTPTRTASVLATHHVIVAGVDGLVADIASALVRHPLGTSASWACFVTGPSRTADIEKSLVLGAHGPLALDVVLIG